MRPAGGAHSRAIRTQQILLEIVTQHPTRA
jgi:hypothetical protein